MADLNLPLTGVSGGGAAGTTAPDVDGGTTAKTLSGVSGVGERGAISPNAGATLTGVAAAVSVGQTLVDFQPRTGLGMVFDAPVLALTGVGGDVATLEMDWLPPAVAMTGFAALAGTLDLESPSLALQLTGLVGAVGVLTLEVPTAAFALGTGGALVLEHKALVAAFSGTTGGVGRAALNLPRPTLTFVGIAHARGGVALDMPTATLAIAGDTGRVGRLALAMQRMSLALTGVVGARGTLAMALPISDLGLTGYRGAAGVLQLQVPAMQLSLLASAVLPAGVSEAAATTLVMHTERGALSHYTNYPFNSFAAFNGVFLGASDDGVFALTGADDAGAAIAATARVGITDFGTSHLKRVERIFVGYRSAGRMVLRVVTEERWTRDYALVPVNHPGLHGGHVRLGRGLEARYWQFELQNHEGGDFDVDMIELKPIKLKRRVGGGNA